MTKGALCADIVIPNAGPGRYKHLLERSRLEAKENEIIAGLGCSQTLRGNALSTPEWKTMFYVM